MLSGAGGTYCEFLLVEVGEVKDGDGCLHYLDVVFGFGTSHTNSDCLSDSMRLQSMGLWILPFSLTISFSLPAP
jgi:hypothetical protein